MLGHDIRFGAPALYATSARRRTAPGVLARFVNIHRADEAQPSVFWFNVFKTNATLDPWASARRRATSQSVVHDAVAKGTLCCKLEPKVTWTRIQARMHPMNSHMTANTHEFFFIRKLIFTLYHLYILLTLTIRSPRLWFFKQWYRLAFKTLEPQSMRPLVCTKRCIQKHM